MGRSRSVGPRAWCTCVAQSRALASKRPKPLGRVQVWRGRLGERTLWAPQADGA